MINDQRAPEETPEVISPKIEPVTFAHFNFDRYLLKLQSSCKYICFPCNRKQSVLCKHEMHMCTT